MKGFTKDGIRGRGGRKATPSPYPRDFRGKAAFRIALVLSTLLMAASGGSAGTSTVSVGATIVSTGFCWITTNGANLDFGVLDPGNPVDVTASTTLNFRCLGFSSVTYAITDDDGLYDTGPDGNRMRHSAVPAAYLPYSLDINPRSATISWSPFVLRTFTVSGTVRGADYQAAAAGNYSDTVVVTINP